MVVMIKDFDQFPFIKMSHFATVGGGSEHPLRPKQKHIHHPVWVTHGNSAIAIKIGEKP